MNNNIDCGHCGNKCCEQYIEKEEFPMLNSIINWSKLRLKHILKFGSEWLMIGIGLVALVVFPITLLYAIGETGIVSPSDLFSAVNQASGSSIEPDLLSICKIYKTPTFLRIYLFSLVIALIYSKRKKYGIHGIIKAFVAPLIVSYGISLLIYINSTVTAQIRILIILLFFLAIPTLYTAWSKIKDAHMKLEKLKETLLENHFFEEEECFDSMVKKELQKFDFYTTSAFYINVLESSATIIIFIMVVCFAMDAEATDVDTIDKIIEMIQYVGVMLLYWFIMWIIVLLFALYYPLSVRDCILLSPTYKKCKIEEILDEIKKERQQLAVQNSSPAEPSENQSDISTEEKTTKMRCKTMFQSRTHTCGQLRTADAGQTVTLCGWMENVRVVGSNFAFLILRDFYGTTQVVIETAEMMAVVKPLNKESTLSVTGTVRVRESKNSKLPTGEIEVVPTEIKVLSRCRHNELPFEINRSREADEATRLKYRYLDLRNPEMKQNIILRCNVVSALRQAMTDHGFLEITTPILTASSPEGARDYLVPSRKHPGKFYALPQAPQQFKQLLMTAGFDRYFQIAPCFRDEDARGDRSPGEFYQLDMEMAFATQDDVFAVLEDVLPPIFAKYGKYNVASPAPFRRIAYRDALETYGTDKPDLRIDLIVQDVTDLCAATEFAPFHQGAVKAVAVPDCKLARKAVDKLCAKVEVQSGSKPYWVKVDEKGQLTGGVAKFLTEQCPALTERLNLKPGSFVGFAAGTLAQAQKTAGVLRNKLGVAVPGHLDEEKYEFCWIVDFPMYEIGEESGLLEFCHNPFSMPSGGMETMLKAERGELDPLDITADQYDLVCNGVELSSGAVRNHDPEIMLKAFELVRLGEDDVKARFPALYNAFCYGAPPHAGIAPGIDRMVMLLSGEESIREVIPFPMNKNAQDVMMGAPSAVEQKQLDEVHIAVVSDGE